MKHWIIAILVLVSSVASAQIKDLSVALFDSARLTKSVGSGTLNSSVVVAGSSLAGTWYWSETSTATPSTEVVQVTGRSTGRWIRIIGSAVSALLGDSGVIVRGGKAISDIPFLQNYLERRSSTIINLSRPRRGLDGFLYDDEVTMQEAYEGSPTIKGNGYESNLGPEGLEYHDSATGLQGGYFNTSGIKNTFFNDGTGIARMAIWTNGVMGFQNVPSGGSGSGGTHNYYPGVGLTLSDSVFNFNRAYTDGFYPQLTGSYPNPAWIPSYAYSKLTGVPTNVSDFTNDANYFVGTPLYKHAYNGNVQYYMAGDSTLHPISDIVLSSSQITSALGFTPLSNITGYLSAGSNTTITGNGTIGSPYIINSTASGGGSVSSFSFTNANGIAGTVTNASTTPNLTLSLGAIAPSSVTASGTVTGSNLSGTNTGDETQSTIKTKLGAASAAQDGYLTSADWTTFNNKIGDTSQLHNQIVQLSTQVEINRQKITTKQNRLVAGTNITIVNNPDSTATISAAGGSAATDTTSLSNRINTKLAQSFGTSQSVLFRGVTGTSQDNTNFRYDSIRQQLRNVKINVSDSLHTLKDVVRGGIIVGRDSISAKMGTGRLTIVGDSWEAGVGSTTPGTTNYMRQVSNNLKDSINNLAIAGTRLMFVTPGDNSFFDIFSTIPAWDGNPKTFIVLGYIINDAGAGASPSAYAASLSLALDSLNNTKLYPYRQMITLGKGYASQARNVNIRVLKDSTKSIAERKGAQYIPVYDYMADNGASALIGADSLHPNQTGHDAIAQSIIYGINGSGAIKANGTLTVNGDIVLNDNSNLYNPTLSFGRNTTNSATATNKLYLVDNGLATYRAGQAYNKSNGFTYVFGRNGFSMLFGVGDPTTLTTTNAAMYSDGNGRPHFPTAVQDSMFFSTSLKGNKLLTYTSGTTATTAKGGIGTGPSFETQIFAPVGSGINFGIAQDAGTLTPANSSHYIDASSNLHINKILDSIKWSANNITRNNLVFNDNNTTSTRNGVGFNYAAGMANTTVLFGSGTLGNILLGNGNDAFTMTNANAGLRVDSVNAVRINNLLYLKTAPNSTVSTDSMLVKSLDGSVHIRVVPAGGSGGSGTVTSVSVATANGLAGTVANSTTTPAITLSTTVTGLVKGNGTALSAAVAGTDYQAPITLTTTGTSGAATFSGNTLNIPNYTTSGGGTTTNALTVDNSGAGDASSFTFNGSTAKKISYNSIGAFGSNHPIAIGGTPTVTDATGGQASFSVSGKDAAMKLTVTVASGQVVSGSLCSITYASSWGAAPIVNLSWANAASTGTQVAGNASDVNTLTVVAFGLSAGTYVYNIQSVQ